MKVHVPNTANPPYVWPKKYRHMNILPSPQFLSLFMAAAIVSNPVTLYAWSVYGICDGILQLGLLHCIACLYVKWKEYHKLFSCDTPPQQWYAFGKNRGVWQPFSSPGSMLRTYFLEKDAFLGHSIEYIWLSYSGFVSLHPKSSYRGLSNGQPCAPWSHLRSDPEHTVS